MNKNKKADVVLISVENGFLPSYGLPSLESFLSQEGIKTEILYPVISNDSISLLVSKVRALKPKIIGIGGLFGDRFIINNIIRALGPLRKDFKIILGGLLATPIPEFVLERLNADIVVVGEGELIFPKLVKTILADQDYREISGIVYREDGNIITTAPGNYIEDLNMLLPLNYEKIPMEHFINIFKYFYKYSTRNNLFTPRTRLGVVLTARGCPYQCNFCYHYGKVRLASLPNIIAQVRELKERFNINLLTFADDLTLINKKRTLELCDALNKESFNLKYIANAHLSCFDEEMVVALKRSGFVQIGVGLESGSQDVLDKINKGTKIEQIREGLDLLKKYNISWCGGIQIGQVGETLADVKKTKDLFYPYVDELSNLSVSITTPYPGTPLYYYGLKSGLISSVDFLYQKLGDLGKLYVNFSKIPDWRIRFLRLKLVTEFDMKKLKKIKGVPLAYLLFLKLIFEKILMKFTKLRLLHYLG